MTFTKIDNLFNKYVHTIIICVLLVGVKYVRLKYKILEVLVMNNDYYEFIFIVPCNSLYTHL